MMFAYLAFLSSIAIAGTASSSGYLEDTNGRHRASLAIDGLLRTGWAIASTEEDPWLQLDLGGTRDIGTVSIWPGNLEQGSRSFTEYSRPRIVRVEIDGEPLGEPIELTDEIQRFDINVEDRGRRIRIFVDEVYQGVVFRDIFISEIAVDFPDFAQSDSLSRWMEGSTGQRYATTFDEALSADYETHRDAQFGDAEAFERICEAAAEGPPYLQRRVLDTVPGGYRIQALASSDRARRAILLLEDPNGISALQRAALRSSGDLAEEIEEHVEILTAHMNLIGGGNRNIPSWGDTGFAPGAIQSFGEPIPIEINQLAEVYVADTGNNRIQRFNPNGRPDRQWGPSADITNAWFTDDRSWYASGAGAGTENGEWWNPTDVVLIAGDDGDSFAALDARGHIQIFDHQGRPVISWRVETRNAAEAGVGGESYLAWIPRQQLLFAFIQNEAVGYTLASEEIHRWYIEDGIPNAVEVNRRGEILMAFGPEVIRYDIGGFRHGTVIGEDVLGIGFEDMDITLDEEDRLWIFTDNGWVYKFRRNGRLDWKIEAYTNPTSNPRIAVLEEILFLSHFDRIEQIDIRQLRLDEAEREAGNEE